MTLLWKSDLSSQPRVQTLVKDLSMYMKHYVFLLSVINIFVCNILFYMYRIFIIFRQFKILSIILYY